MFRPRESVTRAYGRRTSADDVLSALSIAAHGFDPYFWTPRAALMAAFPYQAHDALYRRRNALTLWLFSEGMGL